MSEEKKNQKAETENKQDKKKETAKDKALKKKDREAEAEAIEASMEEEEVDEDAAKILEEVEHPSVRLTSENARFFRSKGNLISLELKRDDGNVDKFERIIILRAFPVTNPNEFLSIREPDSRKMGRAKEIGMIRYMSDFDEETVKLFLEELDRRYFSPQLTKINSVKDKFGCKVRSIELNLPQRCAAHLASHTDLTESSTCGRTAVDAAVSGKTGCMRNLFVNINNDAVILNGGI